MNLTAFEMKCPVCGRANTPSEIQIDQGWRTRVFARYECHGSIKRLFRRDKPCETRYSVEWNGDEAERVIERTKEGVKMGGYNDIQVLEALREIARELKKIREALEKEGKERE